ncbi:general odorant-binding protein 56d-like [Drosophila rhopaloa]|uniref:General odorant-binding protein 56d-like n=1 Tax=Drosophila rhopaloa TaxID=1041015 RepID=A0A6P4EBK4_DRORH|nr:general odorant-binding protein 56d-like [Drosophila rhopaloa]
MNVAVALVLLLSVGIGAIPNGELDPHLKNCTTRQEAIRELAGISDSNDEFKCYFHCILELGNFIANGKIVPSQLSLDGIDRSKCLELKDDNKCELGYKLMKCFQDYI